MSDYKELIERARDPESWKHGHIWALCEELIDALESAQDDRDAIWAEATAAAYGVAAKCSGFWLGFNGNGEPDGTYCTVKPHDDMNAKRYVSGSAIAALTSQDARDHQAKLIAEAVAQERERCAEIAEGTTNYAARHICDDIAAAI